MSDSKQPDFPAFEADHTFFAVLNDMIRHKEIAAMSGNAVKVYLVIKSFTTWQDGRAFPEQKTIAEYTGLSLASVKRAIEELVTREIVTKTKGQNGNRYTLREKVIMTDTGTGEATHVATWDYVPSTLMTATKELKNVALSGKFGDARIIYIERLNIQNVEGDGTQNNFDFGKMTKTQRSEFARFLREQETQE